MCYPFVGGADRANLVQELLACREVIR
jgi:hypothetical protein